jgi:hypothetical protein
VGAEKTMDKKLSTQVTPNLPQQLTPDFFYTINVVTRTGETLLAQIVATGPEPVVHVNEPNIQPTLAGTEYWYVNAAALAPLAGESGFALTIGATRFGDFVQLDGRVAFGFKSGETSLPWSRTIDAPRTGTSYIFSGKPKSPEDAEAAYLLLNFRSEGGVYTFTGVQWYLTGLASQPDGIQPGNTPPITYTYVKQLPTQKYYAAASL